MLRQLAYQPRTETVELIVRYAQLGFDVNLVSPRGNGGSRFLRELRDEFQESGSKVVFLPETGERATLPSAFLGVLREATNAGLAGDSPAALAAQLVRALDGKPLVVVMDGEHNLTPALTAVLSLYRQRAAAQVVVLTNAPIPHSMLPGTGVVVHLPVLTREEVHAVLYSRLGAMFETTSINRVYAKSAGYIKLAIAICEIARLEGSLQLIDGYWVAVSDLWSDALISIASGYVEDCTDAQRTALEMLALVGLTDVSAADQLIGGEVLEELERCAAVTIDPAGKNRWVTVNPPLLSEMYRHTVLPARREHLSARIEQVTSLRQLEAKSQSHERGIHVAPIDPLFLRLLGEKRSDLRASAESDWARTPSAATAVNLVRTLVVVNAETDEILNAIAAGLAAEGPTDQRVRLIVWEAWVHGYIRGDVARAEQLLSQREAAGEYWGILVAARIRLLSDVATVPADAVELLSATDGLPLVAQTEMSRTLAFVYLNRGFPDLAAAALERVSTWSDDYFPYLQNSMEGFVALARGDFERAREIAVHGFELAQDELDERSLRAHGHLLSLLLLVRGQHEEITRIQDYVEAIGGLPLFPQISYLGVKVCAATAASESPRSLRKLVRALDELPVPDGPLLGTSRAWARARLLALEGSPEGAARECWIGAEVMYQRGATFAAVLGGLRSLDYEFDRERNEQLQEWMAPMRSEYVNVYYEFIVARHEADSDRLLAVLPRLVENGRVGQAVQVYDVVASIAREHGDEPHAVQIEALEAEFLDTLEPGTYDTAQQESAGAQLTAREREVAELMVRGLTNRQIQDELVLSIRTVENHVHRLMRKLGVSSRREAVEWVRSWLGTGIS
ncbi:helix-turn-helix transcriptional regulator [Leucobacter luti]|uniref:Regulatory LuxR family protein n=1 Tax=Leucobacter luti TaxID=340320 RepID=A0A4Q7U177_9MICO|nr:helix-turn-helix transcriptional regulator [Leucobacter luti]MBL3699146.1 LuxR family transcriptional regulator [Leucobacter luti]RZT66647.1 regulatory LuxR family protein [Leucobacter luti]